MNFRKSGIYKNNICIYEKYKEEINTYLNSYNKSNQSNNPKESCIPTDFLVQIKDVKQNFNNIISTYDNSIKTRENLVILIKSNNSKFSNFIKQAYNILNSIRSKNNTIRRNIDIVNQIIEDTKKSLNEVDSLKKIAIVVNQLEPLNKKHDELERLNETLCNLNEIYLTKEGIVQDKEFILNSNKEKINIKEEKYNYLLTKKDESIKNISYYSEEIDLVVKRIEELDLDLHYLKINCSKSNFNDSNNKYSSKKLTKNNKDKNSLISIDSNSINNNISNKINYSKCKSECIVDNISESFNNKNFVEKDIDIKDNFTCDMLVHDSEYSAFFSDIYNLDKITSESVEGKIIIKNDDNLNILYRENLKKRSILDKKILEINSIKNNLDCDVTTKDSYISKNQFNLDVKSNYNNSSEISNYDINNNYPVNSQNSCVNITINNQNNYVINNDLNYNSICAKVLEINKKLCFCIVFKFIKVYSFYKNYVINFLHKKNKELNERNF